LVGICLQKNWKICKLVVGDDAESFIANAWKNKCDLIVPGAREGIFATVLLDTKGTTILENAKIPVMMVPVAAAPEKQ
jgi:hypothetical protein